jgi:hypothetical protein
MKKISIIPLAILIAIGSASSTYNPALGDTAVIYSGATHCNWDALQSWTCGDACTMKPGVIDVTLIVGNTYDNFGFLAYNSKANQIVLAFRGSVNIENWLSDL